MAKISFWLGRLAELVYPTRCVSCAESGTLFCERCQGKLEPLDRWFCVVCGKAAVGGFTHPGCATRYTPERVLAGFFYRGSARNLIKALKYRRIRPVAKVLAELLVEDLAGQGVDLGPHTLVAPVPLSFWREGARGFNQSFLLAEAVAKRLNLPSRPRLLRKVKDTPSQVSLTKPERAANVRGTFAVPARLGGEDVLLVDDVLTTGATVREAVKALKKAGAGQVWVLTFSKD
ncbi:MAG: ComF family protein [Patescibacteria group bacterium]|nr:MAG: ComF family protein [Patescibacteria group bacterium]